MSLIENSLSMKDFLWYWTKTFLGAAFTYDEDVRLEYEVNLVLEIWGKYFAASFNHMLIKTLDSVLNFPFNKISMRFFLEHL